MKPSDYYFCTFMDDGEQLYCLTSIEYWNENGCLDDCLDDIECLPNKFHNSAEAMWEYNGTPEEGRKALEDAGFVFSPEMHDFINNYEP